MHSDYYMYLPTLMSNVVVHKCCFQAHVQENQLPRGDGGKEGAALYLVADEEKRGHILQATIDPLISAVQHLEQFSSLAHSPALPTVISESGLALQQDILQVLSQYTCVYKCIVPVVLCKSTHTYMYLYILVLASKQKDAFLHVFIRTSYN